MTYTLPLSEEFASAIEWHGNRYLASELLCKALTRWDVCEPDEKLLADLHDSAIVLQFEEHEAWELREAWGSEECCLACGSRDLNRALNEFIDSFV